MKKNNKNNFELFVSFSFWFKNKKVIKKPFKIIIIKFDVPLDECLFSKSKIVGYGDPAKRSKSFKTFKALKRKLFSSMFPKYKFIIMKEKNTPKKVIMHEKYLFLIITV